MKINAKLFKIVPWKNLDITIVGQHLPSIDATGSQRTNTKRGQGQTFHRVIYKSTYHPNGWTLSACSLAGRTVESPCAQLDNLAFPRFAARSSVRPAACLYMTGPSTMRLVWPADRKERRLRDWIYIQSIRNKNRQPGTFYEWCSLIACAIWWPDQTEEIRI